MPAPKTVDEYIAAAPAQHRARLQELRDAILAGAPAAEERISYGMPSYHRNGRLTYFALHRTHIGLYAFNADDVAETPLAQYMGAKSTLHLPLEGPLPLAAVTALVRRRAEANDVSAAID